MIVRLGDLLDRWDADDGRAAVMVGQQVVVLSLLGAALLDLVAEGTRSLESLAGQLVQTTGPPPRGVDAVEWVRATCRDLVDRGVLANVSSR